ncbi:glycosyltransferase family 2 protein [Anaerosinus massiliensis]|uniref:glycosyltransferase family 2 protein n=1 Tax=Massilibacillus massiliensis TaxID=1806837 RepID=UPI0018FE0A3F|nr:glycosyltransferase family 2 protein [Massilibacillus massiliensis]
MENLSANKVKVTVLMPVYNAEQYLKEAIESILKQTFKNFEFLIINDGSTDHSEEIIRAYKDSRIRLICNERNSGLIYTLNKGLKLANGEYIVRMDADDISYIDRLEKQVAFMENNLGIGVCGTWLETFGNGKSDVWKYSVEHEQIKAQLLFYSSMAHATIIIRTALVMKYQLFYDSSYLYAEDYHLWTKCIDLFRFSNLQEVLYKYRLHDESFTQQMRGIQSGTAKKIREKNLANIGLNFDKDEVDLFNQICSYNIIEKSRNKLFLMLNLLNKIFIILNSKNQYNENFKIIINKYVLFLLENFQIYDINILTFCLKRKIFFQMSLKNQIKFFIKCVVYYGK